MAPEKRTRAASIETDLEVLLTLDALLGLHLTVFAVPVLLPRWCRESLARDAARSGRSAAAITRWALLWPIWMVIALVLPTLIMVEVGVSWLSLPLSGALVAVGVVVASWARGLGGFLLGTIGLLVGGVLIGLGAWLVVLLSGTTGDPTSLGPIAALVYIPVFAVLVPVLGATPFGIGVLVASTAAALRR